MGRWVADPDFKPAGWQRWEPSGPGDNPPAVEVEAPTCCQAMFIRKLVPTEDRHGVKGEDWRVVPLHGAECSPARHAKSGGPKVVKFP